MNSTTSLQNESEKINYLSLLTCEDVAPLLEESATAFLGSKKERPLSASELFERFMRDPEFKIFGHSVDGIAVSYITIMSYKNEPKSRAIGPMYVNEAVRGQGIGKRQVEALIAYLEEQEGITMLFTKTWAENAPSKAIFESLGFKVFRIIEDDRINGDATIEYRRFK